VMQDTNSLGFEDQILFRVHTHRRTIWDHSPLLFRNGAILVYVYIAKLVLTSDLFFVHDELVVFKLEMGERFP
jgi:hypothetical protein